MKRTQHGTLPQGSLGSSSASAGATKPPSPRATTRRNPPSVQSTGPGQYGSHLRPGGIGNNSAFGPVRHSDADEIVAEREKAFLGVAQNQPYHLPTHGSASEYDFSGEATFEPVPGTRGNSPNTSTAGPLVRPRVVNRSINNNYGPSQGAAGDAASSQSMDVVAVATSTHVQPQQLSSRPNSPATTLSTTTRPSSPTALRVQQHSPQLGPVRGPSPTTISTGVPARPASPPQLAPIRGRSGSLEGKVPVQPVPIKTAQRPITPTSGLMGGMAGAGPSMTASAAAQQQQQQQQVKAKPGVMVGAGSILGGGTVSGGIRSSQANSFRPAQASTVPTTSGTSAVTSRPLTPSSSAVSSGQAGGGSSSPASFPPEVVAAFVRGDLLGLSEEHLEMVLNMTAFTIREKRRSLAPPAPKPPYHKDSLEEGTTHWDVNEEFLARQQSMRGNSMDGGRQVPGDKFFESHQQVPGEESRSERIMGGGSKPPSPHPWYSSAHSTTEALAKEDGSLVKAQPQIVSEALVNPREAVPDRTRNAPNIVSHGSAFSQHRMEDWDDDGPLNDGF